MVCIGGPPLLSNCWNAQHILVRSLFPEPSFKRAALQCWSTANMLGACRLQRKVKIRPLWLWASSCGNSLLWKGYASELPLELQCLHRLTGVLIHPLEGVVQCWTKKCSPLNGMFTTTTYTSLKLDNRSQVSLLSEAPAQSCLLAVSAASMADFRHVFPLILPSWMFFLF